MYLNIVFFLNTYLHFFHKIFLEIKQKFQTPCNTTMAHLGAADLLLKTSALDTTKPIFNDYITYFTVETEAYTEKMESINVMQTLHSKVP